MSMKDTCIKIPILEKETYFHWKVKMHLQLLSLDASYVRCIEKGPHVAMKLATCINPDGTIAVDKFFPKVVSEYTKTCLKMSSISLLPKKYGILFRFCVKELSR